MNNAQKKAFMNKTELQKIFEINEDSGKAIQKEELKAMIDKSRMLGNRVRHIRLDSETIKEKTSQTLRQLPIKEVD